MSAGAPFASLGVIGAGAWGTALAQLCADNAIDTTIWAREPDVAAAINDRGENTRFLPGAPLNPALKATSEAAGLADREAYLLTVPAQHLRATLGALSDALPQTAPAALCAKGIEATTGRLMSDVLREAWPGAGAAVLSGPSFAKDVANGLPTAVTLACEDEALGARWIASLGAPHFRPYLTDDVIGAELGGAVKNVLAIAAGVVDGKALGESARAALIARGFAEFQRFGLAMGAREETMAGLSGLGDLILTASSPQSRNMSLGRALGRGERLADILSGRESVSEGVATANALAAMARARGVDMPIAQAVAALVNGDRSVDELIRELLSRPLKRERPVKGEDTPLS